MIKKANRPISIILSVMLVFGIFIAMPLAVSADP